MNDAEKNDGAKGIKKAKIKAAFGLTGLFQDGLKDIFFVKKVLPTNRSCSQCCLF